MGSPKPDSYSYRHKGLGSGLKLKGKAVWRGCLDPFKAVCPVELYIAMNLYLHYDGTCFAKATFHNGATGKRSNALHDTNC